MYCIGITGTVASGKSTAIEYFKTLGIDTFSADDISRQLTIKGSHALNEIVRYFGEDILTADRELNRKQLRQKIIHHPDDRLWLENLLHPLIRKKIEEEISNSTSAYCVIEIPLLESRENYPYLNKVLLITSNNHQQINRLINRDHCDKLDAIKLLEHQEKTNNRHTIADDIINNNGSIAEFQNQLLKLHQHIILTA